MIRSLLRSGFCLAALGCCAAAAAGAAPRTMGVAYVSDGIDAHRLDMYVPTGRSAIALVVFVHGGAFLSGDRREYTAVGRALASQGMAVFVPSYRHFPQVDAQGSTQDVAAAIAWAREHARDYGIDPAPLFLAGHSAGGQIVAMLGTHKRYLQAAGVSPEAVRGVFALAGAYDLRDLSGEPDAWLQIDYQIFGSTTDERAKISPGLSVDAQTPAIEAACGTEDDAGSCSRTLYFVRALTTAGHDAKAFRAVGADHMELLRRFIAPDDPLNLEFRDFVARHAGTAATR